MLDILIPTITDGTTVDQTEAHKTNSIILQKMMAEQVKPDVFDPHAIKSNQMSLTAMP